MRIIAGRARGIQLISPPAEVRPPTDRIKESLFAMLEPLAGKVVVDLFSGSGSMGLEALSRGAASVYMIEKLPRNGRVIERNLENVRKSIGEGCGEARVVIGDAVQVPRLLPGIRPDVVVADPPFFPTPEQKGAKHLLASQELHDWLGPETLFLIRQSVRHDPLPEGPPRWTFLRNRRYGDSILYFISPAD